MNTKHLSTVGTISVGRFTIRFYADGKGCYETSFYDTWVDEESTREYNDVNEMMQAITLFMTSETTRTEIFGL